MELEFKHIAPYLPYSIECSYREYLDEKKRLKATLTGLSLDSLETTYKRKRKGCSGDLISFVGNNNIYDLEFKLHLHPLSDLTKEIEVNGEKFVPIDKLNIMAYHGLLTYPDIDIIRNVVECEYWTIQQLFEWHFDVNNLIENNLAIDINTL